QKPVQIEFSSFDRVLRVAVNGTELWTYPLDPAGVPITQTILSFGGNSDVVKIDRIRIWRDLYYFDADAAKPPQKRAIAGFFVIGDNVPLSLDSRHWKQPGVAIESVKGKVIFQ
ncbi:S26 family signal peptidase, partial [Mariniblastus sp.]|nr:S26 family signal peptidase [Mariniblastus sp.]